MPGKKPASATPSRKRSTYRLVGVDTNAVPADSSPHVIMMRAIHSRAPTRSMTMLLGTSNIT